MLINDVAYLDYNGSSPIDPRVINVVRESTATFGNAAAAHLHGRMQAELLEGAREHVAHLAGFRPNDVIFTAGATEANNLALKGLLEALTPERNKILISAVEHASITETAKWIASKGLATIEVIPAEAGGYISLLALSEMLDHNVGVVSVMAANSETGVLNPVTEISDLVKERGAIFHCDATQYCGRLPVLAGPDLLSLSSHKICGPGGVGALIANRSVRKKMSPLLHGGGHEQGLRSGSSNVIGAIGFGEAARIAEAEGLDDMGRVEPLRDGLAKKLLNAIPNSTQIGDVTKRLPNTLSIRFKDTDAQATMHNSQNVSMSLGSACSSGAIEPSSVLTAMGLDNDAAFEVLRLSLGRFTTEADIDIAVSSIVSSVKYVRSVSG